MQSRGSTPQNHLFHKSFTNNSTHCTRTQIPSLTITVVLIIQTNHLLKSSIWWICSQHRVGQDKAHPLINTVAWECHHYLVTYRWSNLVVPHLPWHRKTTKKWISPLESIFLLIDHHRFQVPLNWFPKIQIPPISSHITKARSNLRNEWDLWGLNKLRVINLS